MTHIYPVLLTFLLFLLTAAGVVLAQDDAPLSDAAVDYAYGQEFRFSLQLQDASDVQRMTLYFRPELSPHIYEVDVPFQQGDTISVTQSIDVSSLDIRPYSNVTFSWELQTSDDVQVLPEGSFTYEDDRFAWQTMIRDGVTAHWTGEGPLFGQNVLDIVETSLSDLAQIVPLEKIDPFDVYVYPSSADVRTALRLGGVDDSQTNQHDLGVIFATAVNSQTAVADLQQSIPYEVAGLLLYRAAGEQVASIPWWLREGIAQNARPNNNPRHDQILLDAVAFGDTIPLWRLCQQPQETGLRQDLASVQSASLVSFITESQSTGTIPELLSATIQGDDCEQGVKRVLGYSLDDLEREWLDSLQEPSAAQSFINDAALWILLLIAGTILIFILLRATRQKE